MAINSALGLLSIFCLILTLTRQIDGDSSESRDIYSSSKNLLAKLQAMEKSALAKKLDGPGLQAKEKSLLSKALKGTGLKAVEKSVLAKAMKEAGLQELENSALTKALKGVSKNFLSMRNFGNENATEKNISKSEDLKTVPETGDEDSILSMFLNKSLNMGKDENYNETNHVNSTALAQTESLDTILTLNNETGDLDLLIQLLNETKNVSSKLHLILEFHENVSLSTPDLDLKGTYVYENGSVETTKPDGTSKNLEDMVSRVRMDISLGAGKLRIDIHEIDSWHYLPDASISVITHNEKDMIEDINLLKVKDLNVYEGYLENDTKSYVIGSIEHGLFYGYIFMSDGTLLYVLESSLLDHDHLNLTHSEQRNCSDMNGLCHDFSLLETYDCVHEGQYGISCFLGERNYKNDTFLNENSTKSYHPHFVPKHKSNVYCSVTLESDASHFVDSHNRSISDTAREMLVVYLFSDHVLKHVDLDGDGEANKIHLRLAGIKIHDRNENETTSKQGKVMAQNLEQLSREPQGTCLTLRFVSEDLPEEPLSTGYRGGMCMDNINQTEPAENVAVINLHGPEGQLSKLTTSWVTLRTVGQVMGSHKTHCSSPPNAISTLKNWRNFFSSCEGHNIAETLVLRGFCLREVPVLQHRGAPGDEEDITPKCGDGIIDLGEECDCGSVMECQKKRHCCVPPGRVNQCKVDRSKGYECSLHQRCCSATCKIIPEYLRVFCGRGDPECSSKQAFCSGRSADCPVVLEWSKAFDGKTCGGGIPGVCSGGFCTHSECVKKGWSDCRCNASQGLDCRVCCKKEEECLPVEQLEGVKPMTVMFRKMGTQCGVDMDGKCNAYGECVQMKHSRNGANKANYPFFMLRGMINVNLVKFLSFIWFIWWRVVILN